ncbi:thioredoxin family protein [Propionivibrio limicola]|uniref:thioredoxin family protein n=1 Tax=Propionivibrio limicola TaxID=167645 RepID=UPI00129275AA|nr:thioredoxin family protein [Propionivibrio limicola]
MPVSTPPVDLGWTAPAFKLADTSGTSRTLESVRGPNGLLVMFICNHCPYVKAILDRLCRDVRDIQALGIGVAAIMSNDTDAYPNDSFANMQKLAKDLDFPFPYLYDPEQTAARDYGAVCTPDFFGFNRDLALCYRGRLDSAGIKPAEPGTRRELLEAMRLVATTDQGPAEQYPSLGCSIKWRET